MNTICRAEVNEGGMNTISKIAKYAKPLTAKNTKRAKDFFVFATLRLCVKINP